jgi:MFS family permease
VAPVHASDSPYARGVDTPQFRRLWWGWTVSLLGDGVRALALPLYVAVETRSAIAASAVTAAEVLPWLLFALPAGALVDRWSPRQVVVTAHLLRAALTGLLVLAIVTGNASLPILCAFAFALTAIETFAYPASQILMVELAGPDNLHEANSKFFMVHAVGLYLAGPLAAGALFALGPALAFALDGLTFVIAAVLIMGLPKIAPKPAAGQPARSNLFGEVGEGLRLLARNSGLRTLVTLVCTATITITAVNALTPLYAINDLGMEPSFVASLLIIGSLGTLAASKFVVPLVKRWSDGALLVTSMATIAAGMVLFGALQLVVAALVANALIGIGVGAFNVLSAARRQRLTPPHAMGRVSGAYRMIAHGLMPIGAGLAGPLAVATSLGSVFVYAGGLLLAVLAVLTLPLMRTGVNVPEQRTDPPDDFSSPVDVPAEAPEPRANS